MKHIDSLSFFDRLATRMNSNPDRYELLGDAYMDLAIIMHRDGEEPFRVMLAFDGVECSTVAEFAEGAEAAADCWLEGDLSAWQMMFADIEANGAATGDWTLNTATLLGEQLRLRAADAMGWDKFHRFNQTLQEFFDAANDTSTEEMTDVHA